MTIRLVEWGALFAGFVLDIAGVGISAVDTRLRAVMGIMGNTGSVILLFVVTLLISRTILSTGAIRNAMPVGAIRIGAASNNLFLASLRTRSGMF